MRFSPFKPVCLAVLLLAAGCSPQTPSQRLVGEWVGRPDTFAAQKQRNPIPTAPGREATAKAQAPTKPTGAQDKLSRMQPSETTDLEAYDFAITLDFREDAQVVMTLNGQQPLTGRWEVLSTDVGVSRLEIVPTVEPEAAANGSAEQKPAADEQPTKRIFTIRFNKAGDGFTLREEGADIRFGWLYFQRPDGPPPKSTP